MVTYPGFRMFEDGSSRVFVEVTGRVEVSQAKDAWRLSFLFRGAGVSERVNRLSLPTTHFETPVALVQVVPAGADAKLVITLRYQTEVKTRLKRSDGGTVLSVDFPKPVDHAKGQTAASQTPRAVQAEPVRTVPSHRAP